MPEKLLSYTSTKATIDKVAKSATGIEKRRLEDVAKVFQLAAILVTTSNEDQKEEVEQEIYEILS